jgi:hypothetical protein
MNFYSATIDRVRRLAARRRQRRVIEKRTYVFILVPFDFRRNSHAKRAEVAQNLIDGHSVDGTRNGTNRELTVIDCTKTSEPTGEQTLNDNQLNFDLMWTWFLPNPLWPSKKPK